MKQLKRDACLCVVIALLALINICGGQSSACADNFGTATCQAYAQTGQCNLVGTSCQLSCQRCPATNQFFPVPSLTPPCSDQTPDCQGWARSGFCASTPYVQRTCKRSCNLCFTPPTQGGIWHNWGAFGPCGVTCGSGQRTRYRSCATSGCIGSTSSTQVCALGPCQRNTWSDWQPYGPCSVTCGRGQKTRYRTCNGFFCPGSQSSSDTCNLGACPFPSPSPAACTDPDWCASYSRFGTTLCSNAVLGLLCRKLCGRCPGFTSVIGILGPWSKYGPCSKTCGKGTKTRTRKCRIGIGCFGAKKKTASCEVKSCRGLWSKWTKWSACSRECGLGKQTRKRTCSGSPCKGPSESTKTCNLKKCTVSAGGWGPWSSYSECSKPCDGGKETKTRTCERGRCTGSTSFSRNCNLQACSGGGGGGGGGSGGGSTRWSSCTKTCGVGTRYKFDSSSCTRSSNPSCLRTFEECNIRSCPARSCPIRKVYRYKSNHACCSSGNGQRIINGFIAKIEDWPWMALVQGQVICGGAIIGAEWIVTAAHCIGSTTTEQRRTKVFVGIQRYSQASSTTPYSVSRAYIHPGYVASSLENDIALLKLAKQVTLSPKVKPVDLPYNEETPTDSTCYIAGWGLIEPNPSTVQPSENLLYTDVQVLDVAVCQKPYKQSQDFTTRAKTYIMESNKLLCAGSLTKKNDACRGDSGGPMVCQRCLTCNWYIAGVTSFGPTNDCGRPGFPGMYTKVKSFESWIYGITSGLRGASSSCSYRHGP